MPRKLAHWPGRVASQSAARVLLGPFTIQAVTRQNAQRQPTPPIPILTAPTAAGKSALALELGQVYPLEIICADAFTVYRGLDIGTAKATPAEQVLVRHHLLDVADVTQPYDVAQFVTQAEAAIADVLARGKLPLVVGGTGFYLAALIGGLPLTPPVDPQKRAEVEADLRIHGLDALLGEINAVDPAEVTRMERNPRRVVRAVELLRRTGKLPGHYGRTPPKFLYSVTAFTRPPEELQSRMQERVKGMFARGWAGEAAWLVAQVDPGTLPRPTVWQALGYREALAVHQQALSLEGATGLVTLANRQYAKRQLTFTRTQLHATPLTPEQARAQLRVHLQALANS